MECRGEPTAGRTPPFLRQPPEDKRQRVSQHEQWRREHDQEQVLDHVHEEELPAEHVYGRDQGEQDHGEAAEVGRQPPAIRQTVGGANGARPPAQAAPAKHVEHAEQSQRQYDFDTPLPRQENGASYRVHLKPTRASDHRTALARAPYDISRALTQVDGSANQVEGRIEENPGHVYKVPVDGGRFDPPVALRGELSTQTIIQNDEQEDDAAENVDGM